MATCGQIIARAFRMAKIVGVGDEATATETDEGMAILQSFYMRLADTALAARDEIYETDDYEPLEGERVYCTGTVTLPALIDTRRPLDLAAIAYQDETTDGEWRYYVSDKGDWTRIDGLTEGSTAPFADRNEVGLSAVVALEMSEIFGGEIGPQTVALARRFQSQMQPVDNTDVEYF